MDERMNRSFAGVAASLFAVSAAITVYGCASMAAMGTMPMPGGWGMSMMWMRMPGQSWLGTAVTFLGMWLVMMAAMMLPSLTPVLWRYRASVRATDGVRLAWLTAVVAAGYFCIWALLGLLVFLAGAGFTALEMQSTALAQTAPVLTGLVVLGGGALQLTPWKAQRLACCRKVPACGCHCAQPWRTVSAWRYGLRLGLQCSYCCAGFTAILLAVGVMDLRAMAVVTAAVSLERLAPAGERVARVTGVALVVIGLAMILCASC
jgi:predicted metal-binding membrane protein